MSDGLYWDHAKLNAFALPTLKTPYQGHVKKFT